MATYRIFPSTSGPSTATSFSGAYLPGVSFQVTQAGMWFAGYWWWVCPTGGLTAAAKCCLWSTTGTTSGVVVPGSVVTSGTLSSGWNYIPLATPIPISVGTPYLAMLGINGNFPLTQNQFGSGDPFAAGITNGPLVCYSSGPDGGTSNQAPYSLHQAQYSFNGATDPTTAFPTSNLTASNLWVDVQVSDTPPAGYTGTYRLWPNKFDSSPASGLDTNLPFTLAQQVNYSKSVTTSWVWWYSYSGAASLPSWAGVYPASGTPGVTAPVAANSSPSWKTPDGSSAATAGAGWCKCALSTTLAAGNYKVAVYNSAGASGSWSSREYGYFLTGYGSSGVSWGPVTSPANGSASNADVYTNAPGNTPPYNQGTVEGANGTFARDNSLVSGAPQYPYLCADFNHDVGTPSGAIAESFWVDLEVTLVPVAAAATLTGSGTLTAGASKLVPGAASLTGAGTLTTGTVKSVPTAAALSGSGALTAGAAKTVPAAAPLTGSGGLSAGVAKVAPAAATLSGAGSLTAGTVKAVPAAASLGGSGSLTAAATRAITAAVALSGTGSLGAAASSARPSQLILVRLGAARWRWYLGRARNS